MLPANKEFIVLVTSTVFYELTLITGPANKNLENEVSWYAQQPIKRIHE